MWEKSGASWRCHVQRCHGEGGYRAKARRVNRFRGRLSEICPLFCYNPSARGQVWDAGRACCCLSLGRLETSEGLI